MQEIEAKSILSTIKYGNEWFGMDYNINLYRGCCHGCIYCDSRSNCYQIDHFDTVRKKKDALIILNKELKGKKKKGVVGIGAMSDTYNPFEEQEELTRGALKLIEHYAFGVSLETKSDLVVRDIDLFQKIASKHCAIVKMTITCADDELSKKIEPNVCVTSKRFAAIQKLSEAGIFTGILFTPILPFITDDDENIKAVIKKAYEAKAKFVFSMFALTLRENQKDYYFEQLDKLFPGLSFRYRQAYKNNYMCNIPQLERKKHIFESECKKYGLLYKMEDIIKAYKKKEEVQQMQLF